MPPGQNLSTNLRKKIQLGKLWTYTGDIYLAIRIMVKTFARPTLSCTENLQDSEERSAIHARDLKILCNNKKNHCLVN
jgi:hypothetical protein